jgi:hypothetical protein
VHHCLTDTKGRLLLWGFKAMDFFEITKVHFGEEGLFRGVEKNLFEAILAVFMLFMRRIIVKRNNQELCIMYSHNQFVVLFAIVNYYHVRHFYDVCCVVF